MADESESTVTLDSVKEEITELVSEYGVDATTLSISLAIELFKDLRNYPSTWADEKIAADLAKHESKIAMAAVEIDAKNGIENQTCHNEGGYTRQYSERLMAYRDVVGFAVCG